MSGVDNRGGGFSLNKFGLMSKEQAMKNQPESLKKAYLAWFAVALFFGYQYILRVSPGVMIDDIRHAFGLKAEEFGSLGAYYLYAYALFQVPLGLLVDRIGVRALVLGSISLCIVGTSLLGMAEGFWLAKISRALVGIGSGGAFMCALKVAADRLPAGKRGYLMGATLAFGTIGALSSGKPVVALLEFYEWRQVVLLTSVAGLMVLVLAYLLVTRRKSPERSEITEPKKQKGSIGSRLFKIVTNRTVMLYGFLAVGVYTPLSALADLWGTAFLLQKFELTRAQAAQCNMMMYVGLAVGSFILPGFCEKYNILNRSIQICSFALLLVFGYMLYGPSLGTLSLMALLATLGFFCGAEMMCFTGALEYSSPENSGLTIGVVNTLNMLGGAVLQWFIGWGLDFQWSGQLDGQGIRLYNAEQYVNALSVLLIVIGLCCLASFGLRRREYVKA